MEEMGFVAGVDFVKKYLQVQIKKAGRQRIDYILPLRNAKKLAMGVNSKESDFVKEYFLLCEEVAVSIAATLEPAPLNLLDFTSEQVQVQCVRRVATYLIPTSNPALVIDHFRETCKLLTGVRPSDYRKAFVLAGNRVKSLSGRQLMRRFEPGKACAAAFLDDARQRGRDLAQLAQAGVVETLTPAFDALLKAGYTMQELGG